MFKYRTGILQIFTIARDHDMYIHNTGIKKELGVKINQRHLQSKTLYG